MKPLPAAPGATTLAMGAILAAILWGPGLADRAEAGPVPPCLAGVPAPEPAYAAPDQSPRIGIWKNLPLSLGGACPGSLDGPAELVVALSRRFVHPGSVEDLAAQLGSVSALEGLPYWSVTDGTWRPLISMSQALDGPDPRRARPDFSADEVLSGRTLYIAQKDTRSHGENLYALRAASPGPDQLVVTTVNLTDIRFLFATLFERQSLVSTIVFTRLRGDEWGYYNLMVVRESGARGRAGSFVNRAAAFERFFTGRGATDEPPLARASRGPRG